MSLVRRARGSVLRLARSRLAALATGALLLMLPLLLMVGDYGWESWVSDGVSLVCGATGAALVLTALSGRRPDWIEAGPEKGSGALFADRDLGAPAPGCAKKTPDPFSSRQSTPAADDSSSPSE